MTLAAKQTQLIVLKQQRKNAATAEAVALTLAKDGKDGECGQAIRHPDDVELNARLAAAMTIVDSATTPVNTSKAFDPKEAEWYQFCDSAYGEDAFKYSITTEKLYRFFYYQAFREKRNIKNEIDGTGKKKRKKMGKGIHFDKNEYSSIMLLYSQLSKTDPFPMPKNPIGFQMFEQYKAVLKQLHQEQVAKGVCGTAWEFLWTANLKRLHKHVKTRKALVKKMNYEEKIGHEFAPYAIVERFHEIEEEFWNDSVIAVGRRSICASLRHRACLLYNTCGILRCESLHKAELSDFIGIKPPKQDKDPHQIFLMITQFAFGKTNNGRVLYGRATRHKNPKLCCVGAVAFYLQYRFFCTGEFTDMTAADWTDNTKLFDVKFLVDINGSDYSVAMRNDSFGKHTKNVLQRRNIPCTKVLHLGRNVGPRWLELLEEESDEIRRMGQWNPSMLDSHYSTKLPMGPIRKLAGYHSNHSMYFNVRTTVIPSEELCRMTPTGAFCYDALKEVLEMGGCDGEHPTAIHVLMFFRELSIVFLQDAATFMLTEDRHHPMFDAMPVFQTEQFKVRVAAS